MRTTLTLDDDIVAKLQAESRRTGRSFKVVVNEFLRIGLNARRKLKPSEPFRVEARSMGLRPGLTYDNIGDLLDLIEGPLHR